MDKVFYDVDGEEVITNALVKLLNNFPLLDDGDEITYSVLDGDSGKAMFPLSGAAITNKSKDVTGLTHIDAEYPLIIIYRSGSLSESRKKAIKEWLDNLGRWLEKQPIKANNEEVRLEEYPPLTGGRKFTEIARTSGSYQDSINENQIEQWAVNITARYSYEY